MTEKVPSQKDYVRNHLLTYGIITPLTALREYGAYRLGAIIYDLRHEENMDITTRRTESVSRITGRPVNYATYVYENKEDNA